MTHWTLTKTMFTAVIISALVDAVYYNYTLYLNTWILRLTDQEVKSWLQILCDDGSAGSFMLFAPQTGTLAYIESSATYIIQDSYYFTCQITKFGSLQCFKKQDQTCWYTETLYKINTTGISQCLYGCIWICYDTTISSGSFFFQKALGDVSRCQNTQVTTKAPINVTTTKSPWTQSSYSATRSINVTATSTSKQFSDIVTPSINVTATSPWTQSSYSATRSINVTATSTLKQFSDIVTPSINVTTTPPWKQSSGSVTPTFNVTTTMSTGHQSSVCVTPTSNLNISDLIGSSTTVDVSVPIIIGVVLGSVIIVLVVSLVWTIRLLNRKTKIPVQSYRRSFTSTEVERDAAAETNFNNSTTGSHNEAPMAQDYLTIYDDMGQSGTDIAYNLYIQPVSDG